MTHLISALVAATGVAVLLMVLAMLRGRVRRLSQTVRRHREHLTHRTGMLAGQLAALRAALNQRRHRNGGGSRSVPAA